ncbi:hypothetical protein C2G38_2046388 [Gigaspora rosea]|uniref:FAR1 domain-containing protein n=1 Tax=Gigaspora rosea TaxID=44941 RepID=A0A397U9I7_9GLOM|nr:hypothetical protein C2G38_2046388 [Gigaspora rosea]
MNEKLDKFLTINEYPEDFLVINKANEELKHSGEISSDLVMNNEVLNSEFEIESSSLFSEKQFDTWDRCELFLNEWAKNKGFHLIKDHVTQENGFFCRRTYLYDHEGSYKSNTEKDTVTKKTQCPYLINVPCPKINNIKHSIFINKIVDTHNHPLDRSRIIFEDEKQFTAEMLADVKFMTKSYKFGATVQRKFLESKYSTQTICLKDLYSTIQKFRPNKKSLLNDAAKILYGLI